MFIFIRKQICICVSRIYWTRVSLYLPEAGGWVWYVSSTFFLFFLNRHVINETGYSYVKEEITIHK